MQHLSTRRQALSSLAAAVAGSVFAARTYGQAKSAEMPNVTNQVTSAATPLPQQPVSVPDYERLARDRMTHEAWEFITSGCADDVTVQWNREALTQLRLEPRVMVDVSAVDTQIRLLGQELPHPILLAPTAMHRLVHPEGEQETARGAGAAGAVMVASTVSNSSIEEIGRAATAPLWFQLYVESDRNETMRLIRNAEAAGCKALCLTVDHPVVYTRDRVRRLNPGFAADFPLGNLKKSGLSGSANTRSRKLTWKDLEWFQSVSELPVFLKGILHPDDADQAARSGVAGIIVSNHGGRALDSVPASIHALPRVVDRVAGRIPVLMDGGIRRGTDVLKALACGATAILVGRPYLYGLAVSGADGVRHVVEILRTELETAMALTGKTSIAAIDRSVLWHDEKRADTPRSRPNSALIR